MSRIFQDVKAAVTARQAAEVYGLRIEKNGLACCPFHRDKNASLKVDDRFYCFSCGATGDAVDLTMQLLGLPAKEAASRLAADFDVDVDETNPRETHPYHPKVFHQTKHKAHKTLMEYLFLLRAWEKENAPQNMDEDWHPLFCEALQNKDYIGYLLDELKQCTKDQFSEINDNFGKEVTRIEYRLGKHAGANAQPNRRNQRVPGENRKGLHQANC